VVDKGQALAQQPKQPKRTAVAPVPAAVHPAAAPVAGTNKEAAAATGGLDSDTKGWFGEEDDDDTDDLLTPLRAQQYMQCRLLPELAKRHAAAPKWSRLLQAIQLVVLGCTSAAAMLAAMELQRYIAVVLACSSAAAAYAELRQLSHRLRGVNGTAATLHRLVLWWQGLTVVQRRQPGPKARLVELTEQAIIDEAAALTQKVARLDTQAADEDADPQHQQHQQGAPAAGQAETQPRLRR
jgi:hypothetical protein